MKPFKPMFGKDCKKEEIEFPIIASMKLDGIRCIFHPELGMVSRSLKQIPNIQLQEKFEHLIKYSKNNNVILDGELYHHDLTFQQITSLTMTKDFEVMDVFKKYKLNKKPNEHRHLFSSYYTFCIPCRHGTAKFENPLNFHCFDMLNLNNISEEFVDRVTNYMSLKEPNVISVPQRIIKDLEHLDEYFENALKKGYEGLILRSIQSKYKFGRSTVKEQGLLKVKPFETFDAIITDVIERFENTNESFKNELGESTKRNTKEDKLGTGIAAAFKVDHQGIQQKVTLTGTEDFRKEIWQNKENYIGKVVEFKGMVVGSKDAIRHPTFLRFREDREDVN